MAMLLAPQVSLPGVTSRLALKGLVRKEAKLWMSSAEGRQDPAGSKKEKGPAGHWQECELSWKDDSNVTSLPPGHSA